MTFLPIVDRELRVMSRRTRIYYDRWVPVMAAVFLSGYQLLLSIGHPKMGGYSVFVTIVVIIGVMAAVSGIAGADSISVEKREGTLGLLFLTNLKSWDIVLGKLCASAVPSIYAALGALPIVAMALLLGGVTLTQFWQTSLALLNLFFLSHACAMLGSALCRKQGNAAGFPPMVILLYVLLDWIPSVLLQKFGHLTLAYWLALFNPGRTIVFALAPGSAFTMQAYFLSLIAVHLTAWLFVCLACWILPHRWQDKPKKQGPRAFWQALRFGSVRQRAKLRLQLIDRNPFLWLVSRGQAGPRTIWIVFGLILGVIAGVSIDSFKRGQGWNEICAPLCMWTAITYHLTLRLAASAAIGGALDKQRRSGGLEVLLSCTPLSVNDILKGQWLAFRRWLLGPAVATIVICILLSIVASRTDDRDIWQCIWFMLIASALLFPDMAASSWLAMWSAMATRRKQRSVIPNALPVVVFPWAVIGTISAWSVVVVNREPPSPWILWPPIALFFDYGFSRFARWRLEKNFRRWAVPSSEPPIGFLGYVGRFSGRLIRKIRISARGVGQ